MLLPGRSWVLRLDDRCGCDCVYDGGGDDGVDDGGGCGGDDGDNIALLTLCTWWMVRVLFEGCCSLPRLRLIWKNNFHFRQLNAIFIITIIIIIIPVDLIIGIIIFT